MGRTMPSVRMEVKKIADRWVSVKKALKKEDQETAQKLAEMAKKHSSETFYLFDDPLEAAMFSVLLEMQKKIEGIERENEREKEDINDDTGLGLLLWQKGSTVDQG